MINLFNKFNTLQRLTKDFFWRYNNKKYLFIHIPKNLGTSLKYNKQCLNLCNNISPNMLETRALKKILNSRDQYLDLVNYVHARVKDLKKEVINKHKMFCVIRNPWMRCLSRFYYGRKIYKTLKIALPKNLTSFESFLHSRMYYKNK